MYVAYLPFVAFRMKSAISVGCDTYDAWLALRLRVVAFICSAKVRWRSDTEKEVEVSKYFSASFEAAIRDYV